MSEPISAERLAGIRERAVRAACGKHKDEGWLFCRIDAPELLAEVERLRTAEESLAVENARLARELEAAKGDMRLLSDEYKFCNLCKYHNGDGVDTCSHPLRFSCDAENFYEWRGVCPANTPAQGETDEPMGGGEGEKDG